MFPTKGLRTESCSEYNFRSSRQASPKQSQAFGRNQIGPGSKMVAINRAIPRNNLTSLALISGPSKVCFPVRAERIRLRSVRNSSGRPVAASSAFRCLIWAWIRSYSAVELTVLELTAAGYLRLDGLEFWALGALRKLWSAFTSWFSALYISRNSRSELRDPNPYRRIYLLRADCHAAGWSSGNSSPTSTGRSPALSSKRSAFVESSLLGCLRLRTHCSCSR